MRADENAPLQREVNWYMEIKSPKEDVAFIAKFIFMSLLISSRFFTAERLRQLHDPDQNAHN
jgi:hypothetical protein